MSDLRTAILKIIKDNDGKFSWYQVDRALTWRVEGVYPGVVSESLMTVLRELERDGFITTIAGHHRAQPLYSITPVGLHLLETQEA